MVLSEMWPDGLGQERNMIDTRREPRRAMSRQSRWAFLALMVAQAAHSIEEYGSLVRALVLFRASANRSPVGSCIRMVLDGA